MTSITNKNNLYFLHTPEDWNDEDLRHIIKDLESISFKKSIDAAIGEGAGGSGFETMVEVLLYHPISSGIISTVIWEIVKLLWKRRPKKKKNISQDIPQDYRLMIHTSDGKIIGINLDDELSQIEIAVSNLPKATEDKDFIRAYQSDDDWQLF